MKIVLASSNRGKLAEFEQVLGSTDIEWIGQGALAIDDAEETGLTFVENAILKARNAARLSGLAALGDDSGLCVDALGGAPGLYSARYAGRHGDADANIRQLLAALDCTDPARRSAHFICVLALLRSANDPAPIIVEGRWHGQVLDAPRGTQGFGYDPVFLDVERGLSAAELPAQIKHAISHRGIALAALRARLDEISAHSLQPK